MKQIDEFAERLNNFKQREPIEVYKVFPPEGPMQVAIDMPPDSDTLIRLAYERNQEQRSSQARKTKSE
jgi:hypothetical protein